MPLVEQQDVVVVTAKGGGAAEAKALLIAQLKSYPDVRIISISVKDIPSPLGAGSLGTVLIAVVESV